MCLILLLNNNIKAQHIGVKNDNKADSTNKIEHPHHKQQVKVEKGITILDFSNPISLGVNLLDALSIVPGVHIDNQNQSITFQDKALIVEFDGRQLPVSGEALYTYLESIASSSVQVAEFDPNPGAKYSLEGQGIALLHITSKGKKANSWSGNVNAGVMRITTPAYTPNWGLNLMANYKNFDFSINTKYRSIKNYWSGYINNTYYNEDGSINSILLNELSGDVDQGGLASRSASVGYNAGKNNISVFYTNSGLNNVQFDRKTVSSLYDSQDNLVEQITQYTYSKPVSGSSAFSTQYNYKIDTLGSTVKAVWDIAKSERGFTSEMHYVGHPDGLLLDMQMQNNQVFNNAVRVDWANGNQRVYKLEAGVSYSLSDAKSVNVMEGLNDGSYTFKDSRGAFYGSAQRSIDKWFFKLGMRTELRNMDGVFVNNINNQQSNVYTHNIAYLPNAMAEYKITPTKQIAFIQNSWATQPSYMDLNPLPLYRDAFNVMIGNPDLASVFGYSYALQYSQSNGLTLKVQFNNEHNNIQDIIGSNEDDVAITNTFNMDYYNSLAFSISDSYKLTKWWTVNGWAELIYINNVGTFEDREVVLRVNNQFTATLKQQLKLPSEVLMTVAANYKNKSIRGLNVNEKSTGNISIGLRRDFLKKALSTELNLDNLIKKGAISQGYYRDESYSSQRYFEGSWARQITMRVTYNFGKPNTDRKPMQQQGGGGDMGGML
jgi:hypothetical protein